MFLAYKFMSSVLNSTVKLAVLVTCCTGCLKENARLQGANQTDFLSAAVSIKPVIVLPFCAPLVLLANSVDMVAAASRVAPIPCVTSATASLNLLLELTCRSQWPRGLRRSFAAARLLRLRVRIPPWAWMFVCCECCVLSGRGLCDELITRP